MVGGVAALIIQAKPDWTAMHIREAIMMTASMADSANNDYGHGILNAAAAIEYEVMSILEDNNSIPKKYSICEVLQRLVSTFLVYIF